MTYRYCTPEEEREIIDMYRSGMYSFQEIADQKNLSKSTVINIVKGYPYNKDKQALYYKLQNESTENLKQAIAEEEAAARKAYEQKNYTAYGNHLQRWMELLRILSEDASIYERLRTERSRCEQQAWEAFANGNYSLFGYYAETWDILTATIGDNAKSPWKVAAIKINARSHSKSVKFTALKREKTTSMYMYTDKPQTRFIGVSEELWSWLKDIIPGADKIDGRKVLNGVLYAIAHCISFRNVPKRYGFFTTIHKYFRLWYRSEFLSTLLEMSDSWPELEIMRKQLWEIEKHRLVQGNDIVPRISDIKRVVHGEDKKAKGSENT